MDAAPYRMKFVPQALAEWNALDGSVKTVLRKLLKKRLEQPHVPGAELHAEVGNEFTAWLAQRARVVG